ncbi:MAG: hypothetical protein M3R17_03675 [Bacteroidota bacterium]|nr:hypothetical protein [Bacteroidota bacterium]
MKRFLIPAFLVILAFGCNTADEKKAGDTLTVMPGDSVRVKTDTSTPVFTKDSTKLVLTHLHDTVLIKGDWVIFLRPDSMRFESYTNELQSGIYEADADFGFAISMAIDTIVTNKDFKKLKAMVSTKRYITLVDCNGGPVTIDRDTVNYGVILSGTAKNFKAEQNVYPGQHYIKAIRKYFNVK